MRVVQLISRYSRSFASLPASAPSLFLSTSPRSLPSVSFLRLVRVVLFRATFAPSHLRAARREREREKEREREREREGQPEGRGEYYSKQDLHFYDAAIFYQRHRPERIGIRFIYIYIYIYIYMYTHTHTHIYIRARVLSSLTARGLVKEINALISSFSATYRARATFSEQTPFFREPQEAFIRSPPKFRRGDLAVAELCKRSVGKGYGRRVSARITASQRQRNWE